MTSGRFGGEGGGGAHVPLLPTPGSGPDYLKLTKSVPYRYWHRN